MTEKSWLFEVAWEVANRVGGIYTVLRTKAQVTVMEYGSKYVMLGPLNQNTVSLEVEEIQPDFHIKKTLEIMRQRGVKCVYGKWLIEGAPNVLLFDIQHSKQRLNEWKTDLFKNTQISTPTSDHETNEAVIFGYLCTWFLGEFLNNNNVRVIAHFHEWLAGVSLPLIKSRGLNVATIFTTHATLLGRYLCAGNADFYNNLHCFDVDKEAGNKGIYHRYCIERAAAHSADVFTTVSHITAYEAENLLKKRPDGVTPNGLSLVKFAAVHEFQNLHAIAKEKINDFVRGHFYGHYDFDLDNTLYFFTAGRYEFRNKGVDVFLESLSRLNLLISKTVVVFIIMPAPNTSFNLESLKGQAVTKQLKETVTQIQKKIGSKIFESAARGFIPENLMDYSELVSLKRRIYALKKETLPPVVTHNINNQNDEILSTIRRLELFNKSTDRVKIIFHPEFLNSNNPLLNLDYEEFVRGCHLGVFPSYYEPWGYTPAECTVMGVPSITTNLSGFGCYMEDILGTPDEYGIFIIDRRFQSLEDSINQLTQKMQKFSELSRRQRINLRNRTERLSETLDWKRIGIEYVKARHLAIRRKYPFEDSDESFSSCSSIFCGSPGSPKLRHSHLSHDEELPEDVINTLEDLGLTNDDE